MAPPPKSAVETLSQIYPCFDREIIVGVLQAAGDDLDAAAAKLGEMAPPTDISDATATPPPRSKPSMPTAPSPRTAGASRVASAATCQPKRLLVIGEVGDGKSTLINALRDPRKSEEAKAGKAARGMTKTITEFVGKPVNGVPVVYLDTPGIGDMDVPLKDLFVMFEKELAGAVGQVDGVLVTTPVPDARVKLGAQVVQFLVSKGFVGGEEKWKNVIFVGTKADKADDDDKDCFRNEVVSELFSGAPGKRGAHVLVDKEDYSALMSAIPKLPNVGITYKPPSDEVIQTELLPRIAGDVDIVKLAKEMKETREAAKLAAVKLERAERQRVEAELAAKKREAQIRADAEHARKLMEEERRKMQEERERAERRAREAEERARVERQRMEEERRRREEDDRRRREEDERRRRHDEEARRQREMQAAQEQQRAQREMAALLGGGGGYGGGYCGGGGYGGGGGYESRSSSSSSGSYTAVNRGGSTSYYDSGGSRFTGSSCYSVSSNPTGPLTKSGRPDMRYSANRR